MLFRSNLQDFMLILFLKSAYLFISCQIISHQTDFLLSYLLSSYFSLYRFFHSAASSLGCSDSINAPPIKSASTLHSFKNAICSFVVTPLSETNTVPSGTIGRSLFVFSREMVKSFKLRLFTPIILKKSETFLHCR